jgi:uncharacterized protein YbjT (DUF2867 family)
MPVTTAIILGASGSVGQALLAELLRCPQFNRVIVIARRPLGAQAGAGAKLVECLVPDMRPRALQQAVVDALTSADTDAVGFSVMGVGAGTAKLSLAEHRAIDVDLNASFAKGLKESGTWPSCRPWVPTPRPRPPARAPPACHATPALRARPSRPF